MSNYQSLLSHLEHHNVRGWLIDGAEREDARTILEALKRVSKWRLNNYMARMLCNKDE